MALRTLMLRKQINDKKLALEHLRERDAEFVRREAELETAIAEAQTEEEQAAVELAVEGFEAEKEGHKNGKDALENEIAQLEQALSEQERSLNNTSKNQEGRKEETHMMNRGKFFGLTMEQRQAFFADVGVKDFLSRVREMLGQKRAITGAELTIPEVVLDLLREQVAQTSKLYQHVNVRHVAGTARQNVIGAIPEAVWTEMHGTLNELEFGLSDVEVDGYKLGGFVPVHNAILHDSDLAMAQEIISVLAKSLALGLDKAILYGTGAKMPLGIVTRLEQSEDPSDIRSRIPWTDLHEKNLVALTGKTDVALFKAIIEASGAAKGDYSTTGAKFWATNSKTKTKLLSNAVSINAAGAIVGGMNDTMPIIGGKIETLEFIPDGDIIGGFGDLYLLAEREGAGFATSEHVRFLQDQTVFKGTLRCDGRPVIAEGFVAININGTTPTATGITFPTDTANAG